MDQRGKKLKKYYMIGKGVESSLKSIVESGKTRFNSFCTRGKQGEKTPLKSKVAKNESPQTLKTQLNWVNSASGKVYKSFY